MWIDLSDDAADEVFRQTLLYWDAIFTPREGEWTHPDDVKRHRKLRKAIARLLEFMEK